jgi:nitronate monooxygenase
MQAAMGTVSTPGLAVAVAEAGGIGSITAFGMPAPVLETTLAEMRAQTQGALAVNFLTADVDRDAVRVASRTATIVDFFWSEPSRDLVELAHDGGALVSWQVGSLADALTAEHAGCDFVIAQGTEAGAHVRGVVPMLALLSMVLDRVEIPVLAAGGIADGRGLAAVLAAGAAGARIGTRFIATVESGAHPTYTQALLDAGTDATEITDAFAACPLCATLPRARVLRDCVRAVRALDADVVGQGVVGGQTIDLPKGSGMPPSASTTGRINAMAMYAGESAALVNDLRPAAEVVAELAARAEQLLS